MIYYKFSSDYTNLDGLCSIHFFPTLEHHLSISPTFSCLTQFHYMVRYMDVFRQKVCETSFSFIGLLSFCFRSFRCP